jgi:hypothetical protein
LSYSKFKAELYSYYTDFDFHVKYELWALTLSWEGGKCVFYISFKWNKHKSKPDFDVFKRSLIPVKGGSQWAGLNSFLICNSFSFASDFYSSVWGPILHALHKSRERERGTLSSFPFSQLDTYWFFFCWSIFLFCIWLFDTWSL